MRAFLPGMETTTRTERPWAQGIGLLALVLSVVMSIERADPILTPKVDAENLAELDGIAEGLAAAGVLASRAELVAYNGQIEILKTRPAQPWVVFRAGERGAAAPAQAGARRSP